VALENKAVAKNVAAFYNLFVELIVFIRYTIR
jgi:hypothetical protein